jgi:hypothetical protein
MVSDGTAGKSHLLLTFCDTRTGDVAGFKAAHTLAASEDIPAMRLRPKNSTELDELAALVRKALPTDGKTMSITSSSVTAKDVNHPVCDVVVENILWEYISITLKETVPNKVVGALHTNSSVLCSTAATQMPLNRHPIRTGLPVKDAKTPVSGVVLEALILMSPPTSAVTTTGPIMSGAV